MWQQSDVVAKVSIIWYASTAFNRSSSMTVLDVFPLLSDSLHPILKADDLKNVGGYVKVNVGKVRIPSGMSDRYWYGVLEGS